MHIQFKKHTTAIAAAILMTGTSAWATNGMILEGYGPVALAMGGAATAIENGTAAMMNNPATLQMGPDGTRFDLALGVLGPKVSTSIPGFPTANSGGTSYVMPAFGWVRKAGTLTYGVGMFGQGGMGTEYAANSALAMGSGSDVRSELSVGRVLFPVAMQVNDKLNVGATLDFAWSNLDMKMAATGAQLGGMVNGMPSGNLGMALPQLAQAPWARIDFSNTSDFSGAATATGWTGKLGMTYQATPDMTLGASYHLKTAQGDMKTSAKGASMSAPGGFADVGQLKVLDFQMPATLAIGMAFKSSPALTLAADVKRVEWSKVMKQFSMSYASAGMGGSVSFAMPQNWSDQTVVSVGAAYRVNDVLTLRGGLNLASNPIPKEMTNPLFPAIVEDHMSLGASYQLNKQWQLDAAMSHAGKVTVATPGASISHSQNNWQVLASYRY
jgi:long-chain fatty acid transport protein